MQPQRSTPTPPPLVRSARHAPFLAPITLLALACSSASAQTPLFTLLGSSAGGNGSSHGYGISADGSVAVGYSSGSVGLPGFTWTREGGRNDFGVGSLNDRTKAFGVSGNGSVVVAGGTGLNFDTSRPFRWTQAGGYQALNSAPFFGAEAYDASFDGSVIVGAGMNPQAAPYPMRWTSAGPEVLGTNVNGSARAVSGDGNTIVGNAVLPSRPFVWQPATGMRFLTALNGGTSGGATAVNFDGSIVVGYSASTGGGSPATMWVDGVPQQMLNGMANISFTPWGLSDDGSVVCGLIQQGGTGALFAGVWTLATGVIPLQSYLEMNGVAIPGGVSLYNCRGISADGRSFVGDASHPAFLQAFVATIPSPGSMGTLTVCGVLVARRRRSRDS